MKKTRIYLDTSVIGGCFDDEFKKESIKIFEFINLGIYEGVISSITKDELIDAPKFVQDMIDKFDLEMLYLNKEVLDLANLYLDKKIVTEKFISDAQHIAIATINSVDVLVSWNFKHIVNLNRIKQFNAVNLSHGHNVLEIRSPKELFYE